jgi:hypothetical protein
VGYYRAGDYYRGGGYYRAGGLLSSIGGVLKKVGSVASLIPGVGGIIGTVAGAVGGAMAPSRPVLTLTGTPATLATRGPGGQVPQPGIAGTVHRLVPGGSTGMGYYNKKGEFIEGKRPTMNIGNAHAARRAVRRLKGVRKMLQNIEREMPHRHCTRPHKSK